MLYYWVWPVIATASDPAVINIFMVGRDFFEYEILKPGKVTVMVTAGGIARKTKIIVK